jgi:hemin uptake protein HemP
MSTPMNHTETLAAGDTIATPVGTNDDGAFERRFVMAAPVRMTNVRSITSEQLFAEFPEVQIAHGDVVYRLRQTSLGKLILTK